MKIRTDFVSNSSSSSFVIAFDKNAYPMNDFIANVVKSSVAINDGLGDGKTLAAINDRNLKYCLNTYELLFLGCLRIDDRRRRFENERDNTRYNPYSYVVQDEKNGDCAIIERTDDFIVASYKQYSEGVAVPSERLEFNFCGYELSHGNADEKVLEQLKKTVFETCAAADDELYWVFPHIYTITKNTVNITKALVKAGCEIEFDEWNKLEKIEKLLDEGNTLVYIEMGQGGNGVDSRTIYATGGWDARLDEGMPVQILHSEVG